jgi:hypothetical protein
MYFPRFVIRNGGFWQLQLLVWQVWYAIVLLRDQNSSTRSTWMIGKNRMKKINWFAIKQIMGYGIDLARIFPIINKKRGISKLIAGISSQIIETPHSFWAHLLDLDLRLRSILFSLEPRWVYELSLNNLGSIRLETVIQSVLG